MVCADGTRCCCVRTEVRRQAVNHGLCRGLLPSYSDIATAMEKQFGVNLLDWLGYPAWTNGRPSAWIRGLLHQEKRKPAITFLLWVGLFNSSVDAFEAAATNESEDHLVCGKPIGVPDWRATLPQLLAIHSFRLATIAYKVGVCREVVATEARRQAIRVPLSKRTTTRLGQERIERIRADLRAGMLKNEVQKKHRVSRWDILLIELDAPGVDEDQRSAARSAAGEQRRLAHRQRVRDILANDPNTSRTTIAKTSPYTYRSMLAHDKEWFDKAVVVLRRPLRSTTDSPRPCTSDEKATVLPCRTELLRLLVTHSFELANVARAIGISKDRSGGRVSKTGYSRAAFDTDSDETRPSENREHPGRPPRWIAKEGGAQEASSKIGRAHV